MQNHELGTPNDKKSCWEHIQKYLIYFTLAETELLYLKNAFINYISTYLSMSFTYGRISEWSPMFFSTGQMGQINHSG